MQRRLVSISLLVSLLLISGAGHWPTADATAATPKIMRFFWGDGYPDLLEPQQTESGTVDLTFLNYEGLTRYDEELNVVPAAAESWEFNADGTQITFHLRENLTYSDGSPLAASRFSDAMVRQCDPHLDTFNVDNLSEVVGCAELQAVALNADGTPVDAAAYEAAKANFGARALDDRTLAIDLLHPAPYFPALAALNVSILPIKQELVPGWDPAVWFDPAVWVGNGPFQVTEIEPLGSPPHVSFVRNEHYWGGKAKLDGIEYVVFPYDEAMQAYTDGYLHIMRPWQEYIAGLEADPVLSKDILSVWTPYLEMFNFNFSKEPFTDRHVREAFAYGFDRDAWCLQAMFGGCTSHLNLMPALIPGAITTDAYAFDPAKARAALAASSYGGPEGLPEITLYYQNDDESDLTQAQWIANQYRDVLGVEMTLVPVSLDEQDAMLDDPKTHPQFQMSGWYSDMPDPRFWLEMWTCGSPFIGEEVGYCNPEYDALVARVNSEMDPDLRLQLTQDAQRLLLADVPAVFGFEYPYIMLVRPEVIGYNRAAPNQYWPGWWAPLLVDLAEPA